MAWGPTGKFLTQKLLSTHFTVSFVVPGTLSIKLNATCEGRIHATKPLQILRVYRNCTSEYVYICIYICGIKIQTYINTDLGVLSRAKPTAGRLLACCKMRNFGLGRSCQGLADSLAQRLLSLATVWVRAFASCFRSAGGLG